MNMRRCYFTEEDGGRFLIPGCMGVTVNYHLPDADALAFCGCDDEVETRRMIRAALLPYAPRPSAVIAHGDGSNRNVAPKPKTDRRRRKCHCGAKRTHVGLSCGVALMSGCEWHVRQWAAQQPHRTPAVVR